MKENKMPLIRLAKRGSMSPGRIWAIRAASILVALLLGSIAIAITGNVISAMISILSRTAWQKSFFFLLATIRLSLLNVMVVMGTIKIPNAVVTRE